MNTHTPPVPASLPTSRARLYRHTPLGGSLALRQEALRERQRGEQKTGSAVPGWCPFHRVITKYPLPHPTCLGNFDLTRNLSLLLGVACTEPCDPGCVARGLSVLLL